MKKTILLLFATLMASVAMGQSVKLSAGQDFKARTKALATIDPIMAQRGMNTPVIADEGNVEYVTTQPEGELKTYVRSGQNVKAVMGGVVDGTQDGMTMKIVFAPDGKTVWFDKIISATLDTFGWIKGEIEGDNIIIPAGQYAWYYDYGSYYTGYTVNRIVPNPDGTPSNYDTYMAADGDIVFSMNEDGSLALQPDENGIAAIGLIRDTTEPFMVEYGYDGKWLGYGDINTVYTPFDEEMTEGPAEGTELSDYAMTYYQELGGERTGHLAKAAIVDDKIYIQGASVNLPDAWLVGEIADGVVTFKKQLVGTLDGYFVYFMGATIEEEDGQYYFFPMDEISFAYDAENQSLSSRESLLLGTESYMLAEAYMEVEFNTFVDKAMQPATPAIEEYQPYDEDYGASFITIYVPGQSVDGEFMESSKLTYSIYINGELFTFDPDQYFYFDNPTTEIPYGYEDGYWFYYLGGGRYQIMLCYDGDINSVGVKSFYYGGDTITESEMGLFVIKPTSINEITSKDQVNVTYYDLTGKSSNVPFNGLNIVVTTYSDGSIRTCKIMK